MHYYANKSIKNAKYNYMFCMAPLLKSDSCPRLSCVCASKNCITCCEKLISTPDVFHHAHPAAQPGFPYLQHRCYLKQIKSFSWSAFQLRETGSQPCFTMLLLYICHFPFPWLSSWWRGSLLQWAPCARGTSGT